METALPGTMLHSFTYQDHRPDGISHITSNFFQTVQAARNIELPTNRVFKYSDDIKTLGVYNGNTLGWAVPLPYDGPAFYLNYIQLGKWDCANCGSSIQIAVIDSTTGTFWNNKSLYGGCLCRSIWKHTVSS